MERVARAARQILRRWTIHRLLVAAVLYWVPAGIFLKLCHDIAERDQIQLDAAFLEWLHSWSNPVLDWWVSRLTHLAGAELILPAVALLAGWLFVRRRHLDLALLLASTGGAFFINAILKSMFQRARPALWHQVVTETSYSFPSWHAMMSCALALSVLIMLWPTRWRVWAAIGAAVYVGVIGFSRMYLGVHFPTDILAGWCVSLLWTLLAAAILNGRWTGLSSASNRD